MFWWFRGYCIFLSEAVFYTFVLSFYDETTFTNTHNTMHPKTLLKRRVALTGIFWMLLVSAVPLFAQNKYTLSGKVTDASGAPLPGTTVRIENTVLGTVTDEDGAYTLSATLRSGTYTVQYSFVGFKMNTQRVTLGDRKQVSVPDMALEEDAIGSDEVVVTGTSIATSKKQLGNAISTIAAQDIQYSGASSVDGALAGKIAGAQVMQNSGNPAGGISVRLRGTNSVLGSGDPLYIVDGVIVSNESAQLIDLGGYRQNRLVDLNPQDIERIEVLKGAAAAAIYGSRASNGVVQIFTKRGAAGAPQITVSTRFMNSAIRKTLHTNTFAYDKPETDATKQAVTRYDFQDYIFQNATGTENYISMTGGNAGTSYFFSGSFLGNQGIVTNSNFERAGGRARIDQTVSNWMRVSVGANYTLSRSNEVPNGGLEEAWGALTGFVFSPNFATAAQLAANPNYPDKDPVTGKYPSTSAVVQRTNPVEAVNAFNFDQQTSRFIGDFAINMTPLAGLAVDYTLGYDTYTQIGTAFIPNGTTVPTYATGYSRRGNRDFMQVNNDLNVSYKKDLGKISTSTVAGATAQYEQSYTLAMQGTTLSPIAEVPNAGATQVMSDYRAQRTIYGLFAQETVGIQNMIYLTAAGRFDASSVFGKDDRWQFYPKASASMVVSALDFWKETFGSTIPSFKIRASYGESGNLTAIGPFDRFTNYDPISWTAKPGLLPGSQLGTSDIKPERASEFEAGFDASFLRDRLGIEFTWYQKDITDLLLFRTLAPSTGFNTRLENVGTMENNGYELLIRALPVSNEKLRWSTSFSLSHNENVVNGIEGGLLSLPASFGQSYAINGYPLGVFYTGFAARNADGTLLLTSAGLPQREKGSVTIGGRYDVPANTILRDANGQPTGVNLNTVVGDPNPDYIASWINDLEVGKNLSFHMQWAAVQGFDIFNFTRRVMARASYGNGIDYEQELQGLYKPGYMTAKFGLLGEWIEDGSFVKLRELSASYTIRPQSKSIRNSRLSLIGRNLLSIDQYSGYDPEINTAGQSTGVRGFDFVEVPIPRQVSFGVSLGF